MEAPSYHSSSPPYQQLLLAGFSGGVLATLSMLRRSSLLRRLDDFLDDDGDAMNEDKIRRIALRLEVQGSVDGQLDVVA
jgi:hypothetical protein